MPSTAQSPQTAHCCPEQGGQAPGTLSLEMARSAGLGWQ